METAKKLSVTELLRRVRNDLQTLAETGLSFRSPTELISVLDATHGLRAQLDSLTCTTSAEVDRWGLAKDYDYNKVDQMVGDRCGADPVKVRADVRVGRWVDDFELLASAWSAGKIFAEHLDLIRRSLDNPRTHQALIRDQHLFIEFAADYDYLDFQHCCLYWKNANDPDGAEPKDQIAKTSFRPRKQPDGTVKLSGLLDPVTGAAFMTAWEHQDQKLFRATADKQANLEPVATIGKRGADALMGLVIRGFARQDGSFPKPLIHVVASEAVIEDTIRRLNDPSAEPLPLAFDDIDKRCELIDGTPLHPTYLLALLGLATFRRQILTAASRTIDVSVDARCFTPWQQHALRVEARGRCQTKGCSAPFQWLEADHQQPHSRGGPTILANGKMLCAPDNKTKRDKPAA